MEAKFSQRKSCLGNFFCNSLYVKDHPYTYRIVNSIFVDTYVYILYNYLLQIETRKVDLRPFFMSETSEKISKFFQVCRT